MRLTPEPAAEEEKQNLTSDRNVATVLFAQLVARDLCRAYERFKFGKKGKRKEKKEEN